MNVQKLIISALLALPLTVISAPEIKRVCTDVKDKSGQIVKNKDGSTKQKCRDVKVRKKVEGKEIPNSDKK